MRSFSTVTTCRRRATWSRTCPAASYTGRASTTTDARLPAGLRAELRPRRRDAGHRERLWIGPLGEDEAKRDVDFGYTGTGSIGDTIWFDQNLDGIKDGNEAGIVGVARPGHLVRAGQRPRRHGQRHLRRGDGYRRNLPRRQPARRWLRRHRQPSRHPARLLERVPIPMAAFDDRSSLLLGANADNLDQDFGYAAPVRSATRSTSTRTATAARTRRTRPRRCDGGS